MSDSWRIFGVLYLFTGGLFGIGWLADIIISISESKKVIQKPSIQTPTQINKQLRIYRIKQSSDHYGFERLKVNTYYEPIQDGLNALLVPDPTNKDFPYKVDIGNSDIVFKEMEYREINGLECFQV